MVAPCTGWLAVYGRAGPLFCVSYFRRATKKDYTDERQQNEMDTELIGYGYLFKERRKRQDEKRKRSREAARKKVYGVRTYCYEFWQWACTIFQEEGACRRE